MNTPAFFPPLLSPSFNPINDQNLLYLVLQKEMELLQPFAKNYMNSTHMMMQLKYQQNLLDQCPKMNKLNQTFNCENNSSANIICFCDKKNGKCLTCQCGNIIHLECINLSGLSSRQKSFFECPFCILKSMDPLNRVISTLLEPIFFKDNKSLNFNFLLNSEQIQKMFANENLGIEFRILKLNPSYLCETTWPEKCHIFLNGMRILERAPLEANLSIKKRKDEKLFMRNFLKLGNNQIQIFLEDNLNVKKKSEIFCFGVFLTEKINPSLLMKNIPLLDEYVSLQKIKNTFKVEKENEINFVGLGVSLKDIFDFLPIKTPVRGIQCEHLSCFSLENFLGLMEKNLERKWVCPICKEKCNKIYIDGFFLKTLNFLKNQRKIAEEIKFEKNENFVFVGLKNEEDEIEVIELEADD